MKSDNIIYYRSVYLFSGKMAFSTEEDPFKFHVTFDNTTKCYVLLNFNNNEVITTIEKFVDSNVHTKLFKNQNPEEILSIFPTVYKVTSETTIKVIQLLKYGMRNYEISESPIAIKNNSMSLDGEKWIESQLSYSIAIKSLSTHPLTIETAQIIQSCLDSGFTPFIAQQFLVKAFTEPEPKYKWIYATVAAELAIKEFIIRLKPELSTFLLEFQSPPIQKLYGVILESFGFEKSPKLKELHTGAEKRNKLIHRPEENHISLQEANIYVHDVEIAICDLLLKLYKNDKNIFYFYNDYFYEL